MMIPLHCEVKIQILFGVILGCFDLANDFQVRSQHGLDNAWFKAE